MKEVADVTKIRNFEECLVDMDTKPINKKIYNR